MCARHPTRPSRRCTTDCEWSDTSSIDRRCAFERQIPFHLRCRTALLALPSVYADAESATRDSPEVNQRNLHRTFQQFTLALNVSESILFLQRPYFVKALQEAPQDPTRSIYGKSYLAVVERCNVGVSRTTTVTNPPGPD